MWTSSCLFKLSLVLILTNLFGVFIVEFMYGIIFFLGICWGLHMNFFSVYVEVELGASKTLFGIEHVL